MTRAKTRIQAAAKANISLFLASLEVAPSPPHRLQSGRPAPDLERDLAAEASRVWHEPVARVEASRGRTREAERKGETPATPMRGPGRPRGNGLCAYCRVVPKVEGRAYCTGCAVTKSIENRDERRQRKRIGLPARKPGRPRLTVKPGRRHAA